MAQAILCIRNAISVIVLARDDCFAGANFCAGTAFDAGVGIDVIDVTFRDSFYGADGKTCSASNAFVGNYVSHDFFDLDKLRIDYLHMQK